jgi:hypothetical protein
LIIPGAKDKTKIAILKIEYEIYSEVFDFVSTTTPESLAFQANIIVYILVNQMKAKTLIIPTKTRENKETKDKILSVFQVIIFIIAE